VVKSDKKEADKDNNSLLNDLIKACALAIITGIVGTYLSVVLAPADFEVYATHPKAPDLDIRFKQGTVTSYEKGYIATKRSDSLYYNLTDTKIVVKDTNPISQFWPFYPYPKKYPHYIYLNCSTKLPGLEVKFENMQSQTPFESNISIRASQNVTRGENEVKIVALGGDGKAHSCPLHINIVETADLNRTTATRAARLI
jgi:hypothetical protein